MTRRSSRNREQRTCMDCSRLGPREIAAWSTRPVGWPVTLQCKIRREPISIATKTYRIRKVAVTHTKNHKRQPTEPGFVGTWPSADRRLQCRDVLGRDIAGPSAEPRECRLEEQFVRDPVLMRSPIRIMTIFILSRTVAIDENRSCREPSGSTNFHGAQQLRGICLKQKQLKMDDFQCQRETALSSADRPSCLSLDFDLIPVFAEKDV